MPVRVTLPAQFRAQDLFATMGRHFPSFTRLPARVEFDFSNLRFVRPSGVVFLSNLTDFLVRNRVAVNYLHMDRSRESIRFLDDSRFFSHHLGHNIIPDSEPRATTSPLRQVANTESHGWLGLTFIPWLAECSGRRRVDLAEVRTCLSEVFNNISDHTELDVGSIFAQWYPNENRLEVAVADFGPGIPETVRRVRPHLSDAEALVAAAEDRFSTKSTPRNRGAGLWTIILNIVERFGGTMTLRSGKGAVRFEKRNDSATYDTEAVRGMCPGTMLELTIRTDQIEASKDEPEDFEW